MARDAYPEYGVYVDIVEGGGLTNGNEANSSRDTARQEDQPSDKIDRIIARSRDIANFSGNRGVIKLFTIKGRGYYRVYGSLSPPFTRQ